MTITEFCARLDVEVNRLHVRLLMFVRNLPIVARPPQGCDVFRKELANPGGGDPVYSSTDFNITLAVPVQEDPKPEPDDDIVVVPSPSEATDASGAKPAPYTAPKPKEMRLLEFFCEYQPQQASLAQVRQLLGQHKGKLNELADILRQHHGVAPDLSDEGDTASSEPVAADTAVAASADEGADKAASRTEFICLECSVHPSELEQWVSILTCAMSPQDARGSQVVHAWR